MRSRGSLPTSCPETRTLRADETLQTENRPSGACGPQRCQAATTRSACVHGHSAANVATVAIAAVLNVYSVAMPKLPPPPPRLAQYRSAFSRGEQVRTRPSAVTSVRDRRLSLAVPSLRDRKPMPPPSWPPIPTVAQLPAGIAAPCAARPA